MAIRLLFILILLVSCDQNKQEFGGYNKPDAFDGIELKNSLGIDLPLTIQTNSLTNDNTTLNDYFGNNIPKLLILSQLGHCREFFHLNFLLSVLAYFSLLGS